MSEYDFYTTDPATGEIQIREGVCTDLGWLFRQVGVRLDTVRSADAFEAAWMRAAQYHDIFQERLLDRIPNRYHRIAMQALTVGDIQTFTHFLQRGDLLDTMKACSPRSTTKPKTR